MINTKSVLKEAWLAVEETDLPEHIHEVAFREAVRLIAPATVASAEPPHSGQTNANNALTAPSGRQTGTDRQIDENTISLSEDELVRRVSNGTNTDVEALRNLIFLDNGVLRLNLPGIKLGKNNADRTRAIATLFTVTRSFGLNEDDTSVELIREEAQRLKCYDQAHFASHLKALPGFVIKGTRDNRRIQAKSLGISKFPTLVSKLTGEK